MERDAWNQRYADRELVWGAGPNRFVAEALGSLPPGRAIDLAAGECRNAIWLAERGFDVEAIDFSGVALDKGRALAEQRGVTLRFREADLTTWAPAAGSYDLVLLAYLQIPWSQLEGVLTGAARAVAPGGTFFLVAHDLDNLQHGYGGPQDPAVLSTAAQVASALVGLEIVKAETVDRPVQTDAGERMAIDHIVHAVRPG